MGLYYFQGLATVVAMNNNDESTFQLWHKRLGHPSYKVVDLILNASSNKNNNLCNKIYDVCLRAKQSKDSFLVSDQKSVDIFQLIHYDLWGPYRTTAFYDVRYFLTIVNDCSWAVWIDLLLDKIEVLMNLCHFIVMVKRQFNKQIKVLYSDNGTEFTCMGNYFCEHGIMHETSCVGTSQQNGQVENKHRRILNVAHALRFQANLSIKF